MKKFSRSDFEKKFKIIFQRITSQDSFLANVADSRKKLGLPLEGFTDELALATFLHNKLYKKDKEALSLITFIRNYQIDNQIELFSQEDEEKMFMDAMDAYSKTKDNTPKTIFSLSKSLSSHHNFIYDEFDVFSENKFFALLKKETTALIKKTWDISFLDQHIAASIIDKYLFLGDYGVQQYIYNKISCPNCKYIGVQHFSPNRNNMVGKYEGIGSKNYIFNKSTVKQLSSYFDCVFIVVKPYATKDEVINYVEDNWTDLKEHLLEKNTFYKQCDIKLGKLKASDLEKNRLIYELHKKPKKELLNEYRGNINFNRSHIYKEAIVSTILEEEYNIKMSPDAVKKAATRFAKSEKIKKEPKDLTDIRDI